MANPSKTKSKLIYIAGNSSSSEDEDNFEEPTPTGAVGVNGGQLTFGNGPPHSTEVQGVPPDLDGPNEKEMTSFWWIRKREKDQAGQSPPEDWRLSKSSVSTIYHSAEDFNELMSEMTQSPQHSYHSAPDSTGDSGGLTDPDDIFTSPPDSPAHGRKVRSCFLSFPPHIHISSPQRFILNSFH
jgi:hypothetical protein